MTKQKANFYNQMYKELAPGRYALIFTSLALLLGLYIATKEGLDIFVFTFSFVMSFNLVLVIIIYGFSIFLKLKGLQYVKNQKRKL